VRLSEFDFFLPPERIAQHPARPRDTARLLHVSPAGLADRIVRDLPDLLRPGDIMVANDTRVIPAQLAARRGGARIGITLDRPLPDGTWHALARNTRRLRPGDLLCFDAAPELAASVVSIGPEGDVILRFDCPEAGSPPPSVRPNPGSPTPDYCPDPGSSETPDDPDPGLPEAVRRAGTLPQPPYLARPAGPEPVDADDYQTIFARNEGAVAAPTAGLHFTPGLLDALSSRGIARATVTLHVGAGTFLPVRTDEVAGHRMHAERGEIREEAAAAINAARAAGGRVVAVGTTSLRLQETAAAPDGTLRPFHGETDLFILPGHRFRAVDLLLTNFHLPRSTLFMLVCAFAGTERMRAAYAHAVAAEYRFYSYGDACLLESMAD
jgi:S-adenosylmethionine:tRNA ribosyltransferase-isomerase